MIEKIVFLGKHKDSNSKSMDVEMINILKTDDRQKLRMQNCAS